LIAVVLYHTIPGERKELKLMISIAVSVMISIAALRFLEPVMDFLEQLQDVGKLSTGIMEILVKAVGIGLITEITTLICKDFGNGALGKGIQFFATTVTLWIALPVFQELLELFEDIFAAI